MSTNESRTAVALGTEHFREANERLRAALADHDVIDVRDVHAQRYLGCALPAGKRLEIHGTPGNDMACFLDGGTIEVFGNAQDQIGNTMNDGEVVIHGRCGDAAGYAMRGGRIFVRDDSGWRCGIHMKQFESTRPTIVIGGDAGSFLGEYMAGGIILLVGRPGAHLATGMHGGVIYLRFPLDAADVAEGLVQSLVGPDDVEVVDGLLQAYAAHFQDDLDAPPDADPRAFYKLTPATSSPYADMYAG